MDTESLRLLTSWCIDLNGKLDRGSCQAILNVAARKGDGEQRSTMEEHVLQALSPRGAWQHVMARLSLRDELEEEVRVEVASLEGFEDEVIVDLVCRHCARAIQEQKFDVEELGWLLGLLLGGDRAASLVLCVVEFLDVGLATSWYDDDLRRRSLGVRRSRRR